MAAAEVHGGNRDLDPKYAIFTCDPQWKTSIHNTTWVARTTTHAYSVGASVAGLGLRVKQQNSDQHKLSFNPDAGLRAYLCGSNYYPNGANMVREVRP